MSILEWIFGSNTLRDLEALASWAVVFYVFPVAVTIAVVNIFLRHLPPVADILGWLVAAPAAWIVSTLSVGRWLGCVNLLEPALLAFASLFAYTYSATREAEDRLRVARRNLVLIVAASALVGMLIPPLSEAP